jgi:hypothetical protein
MANTETATTIAEQAACVVRKNASFGTAPSNRDLLLVAIASVVATVPVCLASFPPTVDFPEHAGQAALLRNLHDPSFQFSDLFWRGGQYRYFVVHAPIDLGYRLFAWAPCPVRLVTRSDNWSLYEKDPRCTGDPP